VTSSTGWLLVLAVDLTVIRLIRRETHIHHRKNRIMSEVAFQTERPVVIILVGLIGSGKVRIPAVCCQPDYNNVDGFHFRSQRSLMHSR
jgi:hypothetical protein